ncbi:hypothetical protein [Edaphovirga cremea]|jgi:hypothetical protein|uniref:hypothetical protein n=1 Tax=Edaphovirga cremea TaxID=2267246 RepID=UPI000DEEE288|nr:hypothetical protein [Edaphovirga cremea]
MDTVTGKIIKTPKRVKNDAGRAMVVATIQVETQKRSAYPMRVIGFDLQALELMLCHYGQRLTVSGSTQYSQGYEMTAVQIGA